MFRGSSRKLHESGASVTIGPRNEDEKEVFTVEGFRVDVQHRMQKLMNERGVDKKELAKRLAVSPARISQIFSDECNITIRMLARVFHALEDECFLSSRRSKSFRCAQSLTASMDGKMSPGPVS